TDGERPDPGCERLELFLWRQLHLQPVLAIARLLVPLNVDREGALGGAHQKVGVFLHKRMRRQLAAT
ncbi:hypothetical protein, partial [Klebsiella sp. Kps]|uniref:hypothetical protein n=1 Tax=Klebsiella sp. Kps TaxID=2758579 RepID=UPI001C993127